MTNKAKKVTKKTDYRMFQQIYYFLSDTVKGSLCLASRKKALISQRF